jgi:bacterioferritin (cytochrome b1)
MSNSVPDIILEQLQAEYMCIQSLAKRIEYSVNDKEELLKQLNKQKEFITLLEKLYSDYNAFKWE